MPKPSAELTDHDDGLIGAAIGNVPEAARPGLHLLEREREDEKGQLEWLRSATAEAFSALDRGEGVRLQSEEDIDAYLDGILRERRASRNGTHG